MGKRGIKPNQERRDAIAAMRKEGKPVREIAAHYGIRPQAIYQQLDRHQAGCEARGGSMTKRLKHYEDIGKLVAQLKSEGMSFSEIGKSLSPPVTKAAVHYHFKKFKKRACKEPETGV